MKDLNDEIDNFWQQCASSAARRLDREILGMPVHIADYVPENVIIVTEPNEIDDTLTRRNKGSERVSIIQEQSMVMPDWWEEVSELTLAVVSIEVPATIPIEIVRRELIKQLYGELGDTQLGEIEKIELEFSRESFGNLVKHRLVARKCPDVPAHPGLIFGLPY